MNKVQYLREKQILFLCIQEEKRTCHFNNLFYMILFINQVSTWFGDKTVTCIPSRTSIEEK